VGGGLVLGLGPGHALDFSALSPDGQPSAFLPLPTPTREADSFEARLGVFAHSVGATEAGGVDANVELLLPRLPNDLPEQYKFLVPRPQFGAMINTAGKTSYGYAGVVWTLNILPQLVLEPMFGGAVHDGNATATPVPDENTLGCRVLFHTGLSGGYRLTNRRSKVDIAGAVTRSHRRQPRVAQGGILRPKRFLAVLARAAPNLKHQRLSVAVDALNSLKRVWL
jgi:hypothetical protein